MASNINRRATRLTRAAPIADEKLAATRASRLKVHDAKAATAETAAQKRKREALGEVTNNRKKVGAKGMGPSDEKEKASGSATAKPAPLGERRTVSGTVALPNRRLRSTKIAVAEDVVPPETVHEENDDAMAVDPPARGPIRASRRLSERVNPASASAPTAAPIEPAPRRQLPVAGTRRVAATGTATTVRGRPAATSRRIVVHTEEDPEAVVEEEKPVQKKRRTSSVGAEDKVVEEIRERHREASIEEAPQEQAEVHQTLAQEEAKWDDLDKEDEGDPNMVAEYVVEIYDYLKHLERQTMPNPQYMDNQKELAWKMRGILMDWLIQVHLRFRLLPETLFLAVNIIDRFLSSRVVSLVKLQLVGVTAMFIAAKYEEIMAPSVKNFLYCADSTYDEKEILDAEKYVLRTIDWNLSYPNPIHFLRRASKADGYDFQVRTVAKYFIEIACVEWRLLGTVPSLVAASGIWLARLVLDRDDEWTPNLAHYSSYTEAEIIPTASIMLNYVLRPVRHESFYKKYASRKYLKASTYVRQWAVERYGEHDRPPAISLHVELPHLRQISRVRRESGDVVGMDDVEDL
ncbi:hypothetical protein BOTBODRAFT_165516 [Botryobasidium botryosum FD-172 SS1]|uniref:Uncharacterized protein n=1 Tax=Botryobasidium botryosum (strain FD-172 SS1) TaxID=930990 RepID=A0A067LZ89_BOTB1|nr:hypothetical protein BOTBODRAFT_165516 [Botryobasidium botryosum FD-172 SS1]